MLRVLNACRVECKCTTRKGKSLRRTIWNRLLLQIEPARVEFPLLPIPQNQILPTFCIQQLAQCFPLFAKSESRSPLFSSGCALFAKAPWGYPRSPKNRNYWPSSLLRYVLISLLHLCAKLSPMTRNITSKPLHLDVNQQIECAHTLASRFYIDPAILEIEKDKIFRRTWQLVGTLDHPCGEVNGVKKTISDPETYFTADVAGEPLMIVRDKPPAAGEQGTLRAFSNVCRHRAGPIALGSGCKNVMRCQYHGWTYTLDGRLIGTPDVEGVEFFDRSTMGMVPVRLETWEKFIFVNFHPDAESLSTYLGKIPEQARAFQFPGLQSAEHRDYVINCNWKVYVDNYLEATTFPSRIPA